MDAKPPGTFAICPVCYWEDDDVQFRNPLYDAGANGISLIEARENYQKYGAVLADYCDLVRPPLPEEVS